MKKIESKKNLKPEFTEKPFKKPVTVQKGTLDNDWWGMELRYEGQMICIYCARTLWFYGGWDSTADHVRAVQEFIAGELKGSWYEAKELRKKMADPEEMFFKDCTEIYDFAGIIRGC